MYSLIYIYIYINGKFKLSDKSLFSNYYQKQKSLHFHKYLKLFKNFQKIIQRLFKHTYIQFNAISNITLFIPFGKTISFNRQRKTWYNRSITIS